MAKQLKGEVISTKMQKTVLVRVERLFRHPLYKKIIRKHKNYKAHVENITLKEGDFVIMAETRPISKDKHFQVVKLIKT